MKFDILDVISTADKKREIPVTTEMSEVSVSGGRFPITDIKTFSICLTNDNNKQLLISGDTTLDVVVPCDRCLSTSNSCSSRKVFSSPSANCT